MTSSLAVLPLSLPPSSRPAVPLAALRNPQVVPGAEVPPSPSARPQTSPGTYAALLSTPDTPAAAPPATGVSFSERVKQTFKTFAEGTAHAFSRLPERVANAFTSWGERVRQGFKTFAEGTANAFKNLPSR
ncbi:MAG TPA: hypothetical protein VL424_07335, partial [Pararobbsia sp.]|nr:hypothetical protein [Pararobbsia sp.]